MKKEAICDFLKCVKKSTLSGLKTVLLFSRDSLSGVESPAWPQTCRQLQHSKWRPWRQKLPDCQHLSTSCQWEWSVLWCMLRKGGVGGFLHKRSSVNFVLPLFFFYCTEDFHQTWKKIIKERYIKLFLKIDKVFFSFWWCDQSEFNW